MTETEGEVFVDKVKHAYYESNRKKRHALSKGEIAAIVERLKKNILDGASEGHTNFTLRFDDLVRDSENASFPVPDRYDEELEIELKKLGLGFRYREKPSGAHVGEKSVRYHLTCEKCREWWRTNHASGWDQWWSVYWYQNNPGCFANHYGYEIWIFSPPD